MAKNPKPLKSLLTKFDPSVQPADNQPEDSADSLDTAPEQSELFPELEVAISLRLPANIVDYVRDYQYNHAVSTGDIYFALKDAFINIILAHQAANPDMKPRPAFVRKTENRKRRK